MMRRHLSLLAVSLCLTAGALVAPSGTVAAPALATSRDPVLFVHGYRGRASDWDTARARFLAAGYRPTQLRAVGYDSRRSLTTTAALIAREVDALLAADPAARRVDIVGHSMGAVAARVFVELRNGRASVDALASLGGPHRGTAWAWSCAWIHPGCRDLTPGARILTALTGPDAERGAARYRAWWSPCDLIVIPARSARIPDAAATRTECLSHTRLRDDAGVLRQVLGFIT